MSSRPPIPEPLKREVRQRCGFGCIFCGIPIYEYEHIEPWAKVRDHHSENLVLLCPNHHAEFTRGQRSKDEILQAAKAPHNLAAGSVGHIFHVSKPPLEVVLGGVEFVRVLDLLVVDREPLISVEYLVKDGTEAGLTASIYDRQQDRVLRIERNEWVASVGQWDVQLEGPRLTLRAAEREIQIQIRVDPPSRIIFERGVIYYRGIEISFTDSTTLVEGGPSFQMARCRIADFRAGLTLSTSTRTLRIG